MPRGCAVLLWVVIQFWAVPARSQELLVPNVPSSHEQFLEAHTEASVESRRELLAIYEAYLAEFPDDYLTEIERCKFLLDSSPASEDEDDELGEDAEADPVADSCLAELDSRHGQHAAVVLYRMSQLWGEEAVAYAEKKLADQRITLSNVDRSSLLAALARQHFVLGHLEQAAETAHRATSFDPSYDGSFLVASFLRSKGRHAAAIDELRQHVDQNHDSEALVEKAQLLLDLDAPALARRALSRIADERQTFVDPSLRARIYEAVGDTKAARAAYAIGKGGWNRREALTRLFYLDLPKSRDEASAAYRELRALGWDADRVGRHRLALLLRHPTAPWKLADLAGMFGLLAAALVLAAFPAAFLVPVHYAGLIRRAHGAAEEPTRFGLRHAWLASSLFMAGGTLAVYVCAYDELDVIVRGYGAATHSQVDLARTGLLSLSLGACTAALFAGRRDFAALHPARWVRQAVISRALIALLLVFLVAVLNRAAIVAFGGADSAAGAIALSTQAMLRAMRDTYGLGVLLLFAAGLVPIVEEFLVRGVLLDGLHRHIPFGWANALQAGLFALMHDDLTRAPTLAALGLLAGSLRRRTGSLAAGTVLHALNNLVASLYVGG